MDDVGRASAHKSFPIVKRPEGAYAAVNKGFSRVCWENIVYQEYL
jgi:hypothetical protein